MRQGHVLDQKTYMAIAKFKSGMNTVFFVKVFILVPIAHMQTHTRTARLSRTKSIVKQVIATFDYLSKLSLRPTSASSWALVPGDSGDPGTT